MDGQSIISPLPRSTKLQRMTENGQRTGCKPCLTIHAAAWTPCPEIVRTDMNVRAIFQIMVASKFKEHSEDWMKHYDKLVHTYGEDTALTVILEACYKFKQQLEAKASLPLSPTAKAIREQLEVANKQTIETNSLLRLREKIQKLRSQISLCSVDGVELTQEELENCKPKLPECFRNGRTTYVAHAASKDAKVKTLALDVIS